MFQVIGMLVVGLVIGILARFFYPGPVPLNWLWSIVLGIAGSWVGGFLGGLLSGRGTARPVEPAGCIGSVLGACLLIFLARNVFHIM
jgi:uncharacterized membrane protein YeaQ/YmgE (transglycosylase-associated protein family)